MQPFEQVVGEHGATVLRVCRAVLGPVDADDAWSETFLAALRGYPELSADANVRAWLVTIAHRKAIDQLRARSRRPVPAELPDRAVPADPATDPDLVDAVRELPQAQRLAVTYHYVARMPYAEVAELTGQTAAAARRSAADGIRRLRTAYPDLRGTDDD